MGAAGESPRSGARASYPAELGELVAAWHSRDEGRFLAQVDALAAARGHGLMQEVGELTREIRGALERFCNDARLEDLTRREVPDARLSLEHVLELTSAAAHRTMDLVEQSCIPAEHTRDLADRIGPQWRESRAASSGEAAVRMDEFIEAARSDAELIRRNLGEVLMAQGYQDLSGQIIRSVMQLIDEIQHALAGLVALSQGQAVDYERRADDGRGPGGPRIPGKAADGLVDGQDEVDRLLSGLDL
jgi:chemotaxis protein CheZ